jgi:signal transduction histidine kinase
MRDRERLQQNLEERVRLGWELHDGAMKGVYGASMTLGRVQMLMTKDLPAAQNLLSETKAELNHTMADLRRQIDKADPRPLDGPFGEAGA